MMDSKDARRKILLIQISLQQIKAKANANKSVDTKKEERKEKEDTYIFIVLFSTFFDHQSLFQEARNEH